MISEELKQRLSRIRIFLMDVDGVLTNATIFVNPEIELKQFNIRDGLGLKLLQKEGIKVGWISARFSLSTQKRAEELKVDFLSQNKESKVVAAESIIQPLGLSFDQVCYMGDDVVDLGVLKRSGFSAAPADAIVEAKKLAHYVTAQPGGAGAVREVVDLILKAQNRWDKIVHEFSL
jgi:3-deoxy-D-manno-octulosonate 8-phosphate phosphatase (KDO 8-P phosphatase)